MSSALETDIFNGPGVVRSFVRSFVRFFVVGPCLEFSSGTGGSSKGSNRPMQNRLAMDCAMLAALVEIWIDGRQRNGLLFLGGLR